MNVPGKSITIYVDDAFLAQLDRIAKTEQCSRSLALRMIVEEFVRQGDADAK